MKNRKIYLMGACLLCGLTSIAQNVSLQPPPQQLNEQGKTLSLPAIYRIEGEKEANPHAVKALQGILTGKQSTKEGIRIYIGEKGDKSVRKYNKLIPNHEEGYICLSMIKKSYCPAMMNGVLIMLFRHSPNC